MSLKPKHMGLNVKPMNPWVEPITTEKPNPVRNRTHWVLKPKTERCGLSSVLPQSRPNPVYTHYHRNKQGIASFWDFENIMESLTYYMSSIFKISKSFLIINKEEKLIQTARFIVTTCPHRLLDPPMSKFDAKSEN